MGTWDMMEQHWQSPADADAVPGPQAAPAPLPQPALRIKNTFIDVDDLEPRSPRARTLSCPARMSRRISFDAFMLEDSAMCDASAGTTPDDALLRFESIS